MTFKIARPGCYFLREALRSVQNPQRSQLQVWCAQQRKYVPA